MPRHSLQAASLILCLLCMQIALAEPSDIGFRIDTQDRFLTRWFYNSVFRSSEGTEAEWTGDVDACIPGDTSRAFKDAVIRRVNYYRAMAGLPAGVTVNLDYSAKAQDAALMMSAEGSLSHTPDAGWSCYSFDGDEAAGSSNLSLGQSDWTAVSGQFRDNGDNNAAVGHRRWILYPQTREMGTGDIPATSTGWEANALWVFDEHFQDPRPSVRDGFVSWPPPGYVPYQVVYPRWSFSYPEADFSAASVALSRNGVAIDLTIEPIRNGYGENTLVWVPENHSATDHVDWPRPDGDVRYEVVIDGVAIDGEVQDSFSYQVYVIDPVAAGLDEVQPWIDGPALLAVQRSGRFSFTSLPHAVGYQWRAAELYPEPRVEGAEDGLINVVDGTSASYPLIARDVSANGVASFHLAQPEFSEQTFQLRQAVLPGHAAELSFNSRLGWATTDQIARAQISVDDGANWADLWQQRGTDDAGESGFTGQRVSIADYAGRMVHIRFSYAVNGSAYTGSSVGVGFYVDDIKITDVAGAGPWTIASIGPETWFDFAPVSVGDYGLQVRALLWEGLPGTEWGPIHRVEALPACGRTAKSWVYKAYVGYYARCPDQLGLQYWCNRLTNEGGGSDLGPIIAAFGTSQEYSDRLSRLSDAALIGNLYLNMFDRTAEANGIEFYLWLLEQWRQLWRSEHGGNSGGATEYALSRIALDVLNGAQGADSATLENKIDACPVY